MPLPDERPRQSVANLIGRFEQQSKRNSLQFTPPIGSGFVLSHSTGDSAREEGKEKREWPPSRSSLSRESLPLSAPTPPPTLQPSTLPKENEPVLPVEEPAPAPEPEPAPPSPPQATSPPPKPPSKSASPPASRTPSKPTTTTKQADKQSADASRASTRPSVKSPQPIRPHHTGPATSSFRTPNRAAARAAAAPPGRPKTPAGTSRPKTPSGPTRPKTPSGPIRSKTPSRPKTPSQTVPSRPKTPSTSTINSRLYAPTAATAAKTRNVTSPPPSMKKSTSGTAASASDRLSKPTAASMAKARSASATPVTSPPRQNAKLPAKAAATPTKAGAKPKAGTTTPAKSKAANQEPAVEGTIADEKEVEKQENGKSDGEHEELSGSTDVERSTTVVDVEHHEPQEEQEEAREETVSGKVTPVLATDEPAHDPESKDPAADLHHADDDAEPEAQQEAKIEQPAVSTGNDIEDIVNMLEPNRPSSMHINEIPDEF